MKVIWKFKNKNKKVQYHVCIFLGNLTYNDNNVKKVLKKIKDFNLFNTLISVNDVEYKVMNKFYGEFWYKFFFNSKHIEFTFNDIKNTKNKRDDIISKYGDEWYKKHIDV